MHKATLLIVAILAALPCAALAAVCPADTIHLVGQDYMVSGLHVSTDAANVFSNYRFYTSPPTTATQRGAYDLVRGSIEAVAYGTSATNMYMLQAETRVATHDVYRLEGPLTGLPVTFTARLRLNIVCAGDTFSSRGTGWIIPAGLVTADLGEDGTSNRSSLRIQENLRDVRDLSIVLNRSVGEVFPLRMALMTEGTASPDNSTDEGFPRYAEASGLLSFPDLPPGYSLVSCQGFASDAPVGARPTTWGRIKTLYR
jgi:hypothetical protein